MQTEPMFALPEPEAKPARPPTRPETARVRRADRSQMIWARRSLDALLREDHPARAIWGLLERLDLHAFYGGINAVLERPGRPATDPQILLAVWLLATTDGIGSARQVERVCHEHDAYRWLCGGAPINYHMLSDFRVAHQAALDGLLTETIATLLAAGVVRLHRVAQDGTRIRASAGASSFRRHATLADCLEAARAQVQRLAAQREHPDPGVNTQRQAAQARAARERLARIERALALLPKAQATKATQQQRSAKAERAKITEPRVSTTDPEARVMKMGDGGFAARDDITDLAQRDITVYALVRLPKRKPEAERSTPRYGDSPEVIAWRSRMATEEAKPIYRQRAATAEWANAQTKAHGLGPFTVRGLAKLLTVTLLVAVTHNLLRWVSLGL